MEINFNQEQKGGSIRLKDTNHALTTTTYNNPDSEAAVSEISATQNDTDTVITLQLNPLVTEYNIVKRSSFSGLPFAEFNFIR